MEESVGSPDDMNSGVYLNKKRKSPAEPQGMPLQKHVCWGKRLEYDSLSPNKVECDLVVMGHESEMESVNDSNSFHAYTDSVISWSDDVKANQSYGKAVGSDEPSTSSVSWGGASSGVNPYSLESRSMTKSNSVGSESYQDHGNGLHPSLHYEEHLLEFGSDAEFCYSEYRSEDTEDCPDEELDSMLYSNGIAPSNYVLSSGRWSVNRENGEGARKLTIDKEFEQYFSTLML